VDKDRNENEDAEVIKFHLLRVLNLIRIGQDSSCGYMSSVCVIETACRFMLEDTSIKAWSRTLFQNCLVS
jgi:hypothetical protein